MSDPGQTENPLLEDYEGNAMWLPYRPPETWMVETLKSDARVGSVELFHERPDAEQLLSAVAPDLSGWPADDRMNAYTIGNTLRSFLFAPEITDTFGTNEHITGRRPWLRQLQTAVRERRGSHDADALFSFVSSNRLSNGALGNALSAVETMDVVLPGTVAEDDIQQAYQLHDSFFRVYRTDSKGEHFTVYDDLPLPDKLVTVGKIEKLAVKVLSGLKAYQPNPVPAGG